MKLELRHETETACEVCGVTSLMETARGETLTMDVTPILEREWNKREVELTGVFASTVDKYEQTLMEHAKSLATVLGQSPAWYRPLKRRWYRRLDEQLSDALEDLRARTRL